MPKKNQIAGLCAHPLAGGRTVYHWKPSPKLRRGGWQNLALGEDYTTAVMAAIARNQEVDEWKRRGSTAAAPRAAPRHSFADLLAAYYADPAWLDLKPKTRAEYGSRLRLLTLWADNGRLPVRHIDRAMVLDLRNALVRDPRRHRTAAILRVLRIILGYAVGQNMLAANPALALDVPEPPTRKHRVTVDQLAGLLAAALAQKMPHIHLGVTLGFYTMQREGDLLATTSFRFRDVDDISADARRALAGPDGRVLALHLVQEKTDTPVAIPLTPLSRVMVERTIDQARLDKSTLTHLFQKSGRAVHEKTFQRDFRTVANAAADAAMQLQDHALEAVYRKLQFRDLRRSGMCWLRELGVPIAMIASISGHSIEKTMKILETYMPRDTRSAAEGMAIAVTRQAERDAAAEADREGKSSV